MIRNLIFATFFLATPALAKDEIVVLALGDSLTAGYGLSAEEGFVPQLQAWLTAQGTPAVIQNAGVSGDTTAGGQARFDWSLTEETDAVIVTLGGNDMLRGVPVAEARKNLSAILASAKSRGLPVLIIPMEAPLNYGAAYKTEFDALYGALASEYQAMLAPRFFAGLTAISPDPAGFQNFMQSDGIHPNTEGVALIVATLGPSVQGLITAVPAD